MDTSVLDEVITGRVEPHIYAFKTNTIPNYLKVGDTYRPVAERLQEWKKYFPDLQKEFDDKATVNMDIFFRDYAVHQYLEKELGKIRLKKTDIKDGIYYSNEFFKEAEKADIENAIADIKTSYDAEPTKYLYYKTNDSMRAVTEYKSTGYWNPRQNQKDAINKFCAAVNGGRSNLLMYAVMRFGKTFTSLCCAKEMPLPDGSTGAKIVLVVSAKADVKEEWRKTVQSADNFKDYKFLDSERLKEENIIANTIAEGHKVVIFLTLQDLQGEKIKEKHKEVFDSQIDLLIVDETHFGARAEQYGKVINSATYEKDVKDRYTSPKTNSDINDFVESSDAEKQIKQLKAKVKLHLSGTPYRILMGSEFSKEDIISFCQFSDIVQEQEKWNQEHILSDDVKEWDNPYYGFPQMVRFAFHPSKLAREKLKELKSSGNSYAFSALLKPKSIEKADNGDHKKFIYEKEVLELFEAIDGSKEDSEVLSFLNYEKIKNGNMCRHIVCVLPYCASCDALEELIKNNKSKFCNLKNYEIINISGVDDVRTYTKTTDVKNKIKECEKANKKTLTLTVNRMLTGSTVEQWDTMIYLKDTSSPQEYDQAIFRIQNQYIIKKVNDRGEEIKYNMKPQTLLVDFDPYRMFVMQEMKSQIYNANVNERGNLQLKERLEKDLQISPIIVFNKDKMQKVEPADILSAVSEYSSNKSVVDEAKDIPIDLSLLDILEIKREIEKQGELGSNQGFTIEAVKGKETDLDIPSSEDTSEDSQKAENVTHENDIINQNKEIECIKNKFRTYYSRILFFAFLSKSNISSLDNIISVIDVSDNARIAKNLDLHKEILILFKNNINVFILRQLDYKIQNINKLAADSSVEPIERASRAINKFNRLSASEITTPQKVCEDMVALLPDSSFANIQNPKTAILDIASKAGEYSIAICNRCKKLGISIDSVKNSILAIPTSGVAYEFTRRIYEVLGLNVDCIAANFTAYDLLKIKNSDNSEIDYQKISDILSQDKTFNTIKLDEVIKKEGDKMKFEAVVGNPPYQENISETQENSALSKQLFPLFIQCAINIKSNYVTLITPSRWFTADAQDKSFVKLREFIKNRQHFSQIYNYPDNKMLFDNVSIAGGVNYFLYNEKYKGDVLFTECNKVSTSCIKRPLFENGLNIIISMNNVIDILDKVRKQKQFSPLTQITLGRNAFGIVGKTVEKITTSTYFNGAVSVRCAHEQIRYIAKDKLNKNLELINKWKNFTSKGNGGAGLLGDDKPVFILGKSYIGAPLSVCSDSLIPIGNFETEEEAKNLQKYMSSKFLRFMVGILKVSQNVSQNVYQFVPMQNFTNHSDIQWNEPIAEIDKQLYAKYGLSQDEIEFIEHKIKPME